MSVRPLQLLMAVALVQSPLLAFGQKDHPIMENASARADVRVMPASSAGQTSGATTAGPQFIGYANGKMQIFAENSALSSILSAIAPLIGARIDFPPDLANERVAIHVNSASPSEVFSKLLTGSRFDYIIMGSPEHPEAINQVIVRLRNGAPGSQVLSNTSGAVVNTTAQQPSLAKDFYGEARLPNGLTPQEQVLSREELYQKFASAQQTQKEQQQKLQEQNDGPESKVGRH